MITQLILDTEFAKSGTPIAFLAFEPGDSAAVELPDGRQVIVDAAAVDAHEPEESLATLAILTGISYDTLAKYAREGRFLARKSGATWLSTVRAVGAAGIKPHNARLDRAAQIARQREWLDAMERHEEAEGR